MKAKELQIARLNVRAGETVVVKINEPLTVGMADQARAYVAAALPSDVKVLVLDAKADISVIERREPKKR